MNEPTRPIPTTATWPESSGSRWATGALCRDNAAQPRERRETPSPDQGEGQHQAALFGSKQFQVHPACTTMNENSPIRLNPAATTSMVFGEAGNCASVLWRPFICFFRSAPKTGRPSCPERRKTARDSNPRHNGHGGWRL